MLDFSLENIEISKMSSSVLCLGCGVLRAKCFNRHAPLSESRLYMYLSIPKRSRRSHRGISRTSSSTTRISGQCSGRLGRQIDPAPVLLSEYKHTVLALRVITLRAEASKRKQVQLCESLLYELRLLNGSRSSSASHYSTS